MEQNVEKQKQTYQIEVKGQLDPNWRVYFEGFDLSASSSQGTAINTLLVGQIEDQSALHGILNKIRDLNLVLLSLHQISESKLLNRKLNNLKDKKNV